MEEETDIINSDINRDNPETDAELFSTYGPIAKTVDPNAFVNLTDEEVTVSRENVMAGLEETEPVVVPSEQRPLATTLVAVASAPPFTPEGLMLREENLKAAQLLIDSQQETMVRSNLAVERQLNTLKNLEAYKESIAKAGPGVFSPEVAKGIQETTSAIAQERIDENARTALEYEVVERVQDLLASGDPVQAKLIADLYIPGRRGNAQQVMHDEAVKNLILAQRAEELNAEYGRQGWGEFLASFAISLVPSVYNFKRSGILDDAGVKNDVTGFMNWLLSGSSLQSQGEVLWRLPPKEFARVMAQDGPIIQSLRENATYLGATDIGAMMSNLSMMTEYTGEDERAWANLWGVVDPLLAVPFGKVGSVAKSLTRLGARSTARATVADAYETILKEGAGAAQKRGILVDDVVEEIELKPMVNQGLEVPIAMDVDAGIYAARAAINDVVEGGVYVPSRFTNEEELAAAFQSASAERMAEFGDNVKNVQFMVRNLGDDTDEVYTGVIKENQNVTYSVEVTFGRKGDGGFASESSAKTMATKMGLAGVETMQDTSGQWFFKQKFNIREEGFLTTGLKTPDVKMGNWGIRSAAQISDTFSHSKATTAGSFLNRMQTEFTKQIRNVFKSVNAEDKFNLDEIIKYGQTKAKWFTPQEFELMYTRISGRAPSSGVTNAYNQYRKLHDIDYVIRNDALHIQRSREGGESVEFALGKTGMKIDTDAVIVLDPTKRPVGNVVFDASEGKWIKDWQTKSMKEYSDDGYVLLKTFDEVRFPDGDGTHAILLKKTDLKRRPLRSRVLAYSEGGHRAYEGKWTAKQARKNSQDQFLNPHTFVIDMNKNSVVKWVDEMERARQAYLAGTVDPVALDNILVSPGTMDGQSFVKAMDEGWIDKKHPIEVVFTREKPTAYHNADSAALRFLDPEEWDFTGYARTSGRMYYGRKGEHMLDTNGQHAATIDPWDTLNRALGNAARLSSFSSYKTNLLERFKRSYGAGLNLKNVMNSDNLYELAKAPIRDDIVRSNPTLANKIRQEQRSVDFILNFETAWEKKYNQWTKSMAEWSLGRGEAGSLREKAHNAVFHLSDNNPVSSMRGLAFDAKLGFFNFGQFIIQTSTAMSAMFLNPRFGFRGVVGSWPMTMLHLRGWKPNDVDWMAKIGMPKFMGFSGEREFKDFVKLMNRSGLMDVSNTHLQINTYGPSKVFGAMGKVDQMREWGRTFFYAAEQVNRATAARIAWGELKNAGVKLGTADFRERFIKLTDDYSFNMMRESGASFQKGLTSIPTQFWSYSFRMMEAMFGKRFTPAQKFRLWSGMFLATGAAGIPGGDLVSELFSNINGGELPGFDSESSNQQLMAAMERGLIDYGLYLGTDADMRLGEKLGTGGLITDVVKDLFGFGDYGEKSFMETLAGATGSIWLSAGDTTSKIIKYGIAESGKGGYELTKDELVKLGREVSTFSNALKAGLFVEKGIYQSKSGTVQYYEEDEEKRRNMVEAFLIAAGIQPGETQTVEDRMNYFTEKSEERKEFVKIVRNLRQEAFTNPDKYEENMRKINTLIGMIPSEIQQDVLEESRLYDGNKSLYDSLAKQWEEEMTQKELRERLESEYPEIMNNDLTVEQPLVRRQ